jgi:hypothetical protein
VAFDKRQLDSLRQRLATNAAARLAVPRGGVVSAVPLPPKQVTSAKVGEPAKGGQQAAVPRGADPARADPDVAGKAIVVVGAGLGQAGAVSDGTLSDALIPPSSRDPNGVPYLQWAATNIKSELRFTVNASSAGAYTLYLSFLKLRDSAPVAVFVNGQRAGQSFDPTGYVGVAKISFGRVELKAGANQIALRLEPDEGKDRSEASVAVLQILLEPSR